MKRRLRAAWVAAAVLGVAVVLAACGGDDSTGTESGSSGGGSGELETISLVQPVPGESMFFYQYPVGEELGFFEEEGVKLDFLSASSDLPLPAFVQNGDADVADSGADETLIAVSKGAELLAVYEETRAAADTISVPEDSDIQGVTDLDGKTVGIGGQDDRVVLETALELEGVDPGSVRIVSIGEGGPTIAQAITSGKIDAYGSGISDKAITEALGEITFREILPEELRNHPSGAFIVKPELFEERRDVLVGFIRAWAKATQAGLIDREAIEEIGRERIPEQFENEAVMERIIDISLELRDPGDEPHGEMNVEEWESAQDQLISAGELSDPVDIESVVDEALIEEVNEFDNEEIETAIEEWREENK